jgi:PKD repeat protein
MKRLWIVGAAAAITLSACSPATLDVIPLQISVDATPTSAAVGDTVTFVATVQGNSLLGVDADFGDGGTDRYGTSGARTGKVTFRHPFLARGTYTVKITVTDGDAATKAAMLDVQIL